MSIKAYEAYKELQDTPYRIWFKEYDENGNEIGTGVFARSYKNYGNARHKKQEYYGDSKRYKAIVAKRNPFENYYVEDHCDICGGIYQRPVDADGRDQGNDLYLKYRDENDGVIRIHRYICEDCASEIANFALQRLSTDAKNG